LKKQGLFFKTISQRSSTCVVQKRYK